MQKHIIFGLGYYFDGVLELRVVVRDEVVEMTMLWSLTVDISYLLFNIHRQLIVEIDIQYIIKMHPMAALFP